MRHIFLVSGVAAVSIIVTYFIMYYSFREKIYEKDYFEVLGIKDSFFYKDIINSIGRPVSENETSEEIDYLNSYYDGYSLFFKKNTNEIKDKFFLLNAKITSSKFKFGKKQISVGSSFEEVRKAYKNVKTISDVKNGYIDGETWVEFEFNNDSKVKSILIYYGP